MPVAYPFSTLGKLNGLSGCVPKVDVTPYDYWITASGYSKDDFDASVAVTQDQIDQSLHAIGRLYWNLYRVTCATGLVSIPSSMLTEVIVSGWDAPIDPIQPDPIQPKDRVCRGPMTRGGDTYPNLGDVSLCLESRPWSDFSETLPAFARFYKGDTTDEENFIGFGLGKITWNSQDPHLIAPIAQWYIDVFIDPQSFLGGYADDTVGSGRKKEFAYVERGGIYMLWLGVISDDSPLGPGITTHVDSDTLRAWLVDSSGV